MHQDAISYGSRHVVFGDPAIPPKGAQPPIIGPCLLWPNRPTAGWIKMPLCMEVGLGPGHIVLDGNPAPPPQRGKAPNFWLMCIVAKRSSISATAEHLLLWPPYIIGQTIIFLFCGFFFFLYGHAIWNRAGHYIFALWFLLSSIFFYLFSSPNLSRCRLDVCHTSTHGMASVQI